MSEEESRSGNSTAGAGPADDRTGRDRRYRILIADDNSRTGNKIALLLRSRFDVKLAADGEAAMSALGREPFDLLIADYSMPGIDGLDLVRELRANPHIREIPVLVTSARVGEGVRQQALSAGADDYIEKPFTAIELMETIGRLLGRSGP
jgi:CheY-like chemotaxis protein